jgi:hypothetical protein
VLDDQVVPAFSDDVAGVRVVARDDLVAFDASPLPAERAA